MLQGWVGKQSDIAADQHGNHRNVPKEGRNRSSEEMLLTKSTPSEKAGNGQKEHADGGNKDRPGQSLPVGRAAACASGKADLQKHEMK